MSCPVCQGYSSENCPSCSKTETRTCPTCNGEGVRYYAFNIHTRIEFEVSKDYYYTLPYDEDEAYDMRVDECQCEKISCKTCWGAGDVS